MQVATAQAIAAPTTFEVCFSCSYQSSARGGSVCPRCSFPLITRSDMSPSGGLRLSDVLHRESIRIGAPPLPGVHAEKRKAQALAEARRARHTLGMPSVEPASPECVPQSASAGTLWNLVFVCLTAVGFGVTAAVMQSAL